MKSIITLCDGTWDKPGEKDKNVVVETNVQKIKRLISPRDAAGNLQLINYLNGVGSTGSILDQVSGGISGEGIDAIIKNAYRFIVDNYEEGDKNYILGFSRGSYTARSLAGLIVNCGILKKENDLMIDTAYQFYRDRGADTSPSSAEAVKFRADNSHPDPVEIEFIGVWDTVGAMGIPILPFILLDRSKYEFHDMKLSNAVKYAYHALALDEHRYNFDVTLWEKPAGSTTQLEQVWFTGAHRNVGGGYIDGKLSDHTLQWMVGKAAGAGLAFNTPPAGYYTGPVLDGVIIESNTLVWRLAAGLAHNPPDNHYRTATPGLDGQSVDQSVYDRRQADKKYKFKNLPPQTP